MNKGQLFVLGVMCGILLLVTWNSLEQSSLSVLSPEGPQVSILGFRMKHWYLGVVMMGLFVIFRNKTEFAYFYLGLGIILFFDELNEIFNL